MKAKEYDFHKMSLAAAAGIRLLAGLLGFIPAARADSVVAWGRNDNGQLGNETTNGSTTPVAVIGLSSGVTAIAAGTSHSLAIQNGTALAWGDNFYGELGNGSNTSSTTPVAVAGLAGGVTGVAAGDNYSLAIQNGAALAWGDNYYGQLGNGTYYTTSDMPEVVSGLTSGVTAVAGNFGFSLAIQNGAAMAWGLNNYGQLGNDTTASSAIPVTVTGLSSGVTAISGGDYDSLAIQNGKLVAWGFNGQGELGNGSSVGYSTTPVAVSGLSSGVTAVAAGSFFNLAIQNGKVYAWGDNDAGQLGDGTVNDSSTPVLIDPADLNNIVAVAASLMSSYALSSDGSLWVWGYNFYGQLGLGTSTVNYLTPQHLLAPNGYIFTSIDADGDGFHAVATLKAIPEPASLLLLATGGIALMRRRHTA